MIVKVPNFRKYKTIVSCQINHPKNEVGWGGNLTIAHRVQAFSRKIEDSEGWDIVLYSDKYGDSVTDMRSKAENYRSLYPNSRRISKTKVKL